MLNHSHGGNIEATVREFALSRSEIIDFSANINPLGYPSQLPEIIKSNIDRILHYPDPKAITLREKLAERFSLDPQTILVGNGSTELIYLLPRALNPKSAGLITPAYSDLERYKEPWTINILAQAAGEHIIFDDEYIRQSRDFISTEKEFLYQKLAQIRPFYPFKPSANFILILISDCGLQNKKSAIQNPQSAILRKALIKKGFLIRDCSNFRGLDGRFFRLAIRTREENTGIVCALRGIANRPL